MSTLAVVEEILRETSMPMSVREIVEHAGSRLPSKSKTPDTVVARDLSMDIKKKGELSLFVRTSPGRYTLRELHLRGIGVAATMGATSPLGNPTLGNPAVDTSVMTATLRNERAAPMASGQHLAAAAAPPAVLRIR
jgi:hypothetical protein